MYSILCYYCSLVFCKQQYWQSTLPYCNSSSRKFLIVCDSEWCIVCLGGVCIDNETNQLLGVSGILSFYLFLSIFVAMLISKFRYWRRCLVCFSFFFLEISSCRISWVYSRNEFHVRNLLLYFEYLTILPSLFGWGSLTMKHEINCYLLGVFGVLFFCLFLSFFVVLLISKLLIWRHCLICFSFSI